MAFTAGVNATSLEWVWVSDIETSGSSRQRSAVFALQHGPFQNLNNHPD
jgi:hypothetical protein